MKNPFPMKGRDKPPAKKPGKGPAKLPVPYGKFPPKKQAK